MEASLLNQESRLRLGEVSRVLEEISDINDYMRSISNEAFKDIMFILFSLALLYILVLPCNTMIPLPLSVIGAVFSVFTAVSSIFQLKQVEKRTISVRGQEFTVGKRKWLHVVNVLVWAIFGLVGIVYLSFCSKPCSV
ncbi:hypothetical protein AQUCO_01300779v1 [Aquilegia coerulea]|uniref:Uncharacterized protein n=1 Tax=Aquilegia coerulea TaxID=218851 RepID=A0A2G5E3Z7_AQUCA|nr:hypothetical protein AQUCO_01300779v1 [Aquilegia coerulea]